MRVALPVLALFAFVLVSFEAEAKSCSSYATIKAYSGDKQAVKVKFKKGKVNKYFPLPEGAPSDSLKVPGSCPGKVVKNTTLKVVPTGGRMTVTQVRSNFEGKMLNDTEDEAWLPGQLKSLISEKTQVVVVVRPGKKKSDGNTLSTIYLPGLRGA